MLCSLPVLLLLLLLSFQESAAFTPPSRIRGVTRSVQQPTSLPAQKKRRRRRIAPDSSGSGNIDPSPRESDELPDFDLGDDGDSAKVEKDATPAASSDPMGDISSAMMGTSNQPVRSVDQLIADRALEKNFEFDEPGDDALPDLAVLAREQEAGRKRSKRDARVAAAMERNKQEEDEVNPLSKIPFFVDENGEVSAIKVSISG